MPGNEQRGGIGRWLAIGFYVTALAYLIIVGFASVIPQVFWPTRDNAYVLDCNDGLELLRHEIDELRLRYLRTNETDPTMLREALRSWDLRLNALAERCSVERVRLLERYRHRVELKLERYMREDAPLAERAGSGFSPADEPSSGESPERSR